MPSGKTALSEERVKLAFIGRLSALFLVKEVKKITPAVMYHLFVAPFFSAEPWKVQSVWKNKRKNFGGKISWSYHKGSFLQFYTENSLQKEKKEKRPE